MNDKSIHHPNAPIKDLAAVVAAYRQSGQSLKEFALKRGMRAAQLHYWVYHKSEHAKPRSWSQKPPVDQTGVFQELKLETGSALLQSWAAEVNVARGVNARFSGTASPEWIGAVVQALQRPC